MKHDQEHKNHVCKFCEQSFSSGRKLGGHMRCHIALISATRKMDARENDQVFINGGNGLGVYDDHDQVIKKVQGIDQDYHANGRKQSIQEHDREVINGGKGYDDDDLIVKSRQGMYFDQDYDTNARKQVTEEHDQDVSDDEKGLDFDDDNDEKKSQQAIDFDQDYGANGYVLRENPKRSWRVSNSNLNSPKTLASQKRYHSRKESIKNMNTVCEKCGKGFDSVKALYGHMRCHSVKKSQPLDESSALSSSEEEEEEHEDEVANPVRKKRSCTRYKSPKRNHLSTSLDSSNGDDVVEGAINLVMMSMGVRDFDDEVKSVIPRRYSRAFEKDVEFEVSEDESMEDCEFKVKSEMGLKKDSGSGQFDVGRVGSSIVKSKSTKNPSSMDQDFTYSEMSVELKRRSKDHICPICFKGYVSVQGLARHKRWVHFKSESKEIESDDIPDIDRLVVVNLMEVSKRTM